MISPGDKVEEARDGEFLFFCPGCKNNHAFWTAKAPGEHPSWTFDGNLKCPTVSPSIRVTLGAWPGEPQGRVCHFFIRAGMIEFCSDSFHEMAGKTVPMLDAD